ncbi:hypothetical protein BJX62DRAFT_28589 [Aspergillus germanicus]
MDGWAKGLRVFARPRISHGLGIQKRPQVSSSRIPLPHPLNYCRKAKKSCMSGLVATSGSTRPFRYMHCHIAVIWCFVLLRRRQIRSYLTEPMHTRQGQRSFSMTRHSRLLLIHLQSSQLRENRKSRRQ